MTIEKRIEKNLVDNGLFPEMAEQVMQLVKDDPFNESMKPYWNTDESDVPSTLLTAVWMSTKRHALEWIDANMPLHFARELFV